MFTSRFTFQHPRRLFAAAVLVLVAVALVVAATLPRDREHKKSFRTVEPRTSTTTQDGEAGRFFKEDVASPAAAAGAAADMIGGDTDVSAAKSTTIAEPAPEFKTTARAVEPKLVRTATIAMRIDDGKFDAVWDSIRRVGDGARVTVVDASRSDRGDSGSLGTMTLRVPSARLDAIVDDLRGVAHVKVDRLDVSSDDVSDEYVDTTSRLRHDRAVERRLVTLLADTKNVGEVLAVQARLDSVQEQIEISAGRVAYLDAVTSTSTITVSLRERAAGAATGDHKDPSALSEAFDDARERFVGNIADAIVWTGGALPILLLLAVIAIAGRLIWRRVVGRTDRAMVGPTDPS